MTSYLKYCKEHNVSFPSDKECPFCNGKVNKMTKLKESLYKTLEQVCEQHMKSYKTHGGRNKETKKWLTRIKWVDEKLALEGGEN